MDSSLPLFDSSLHKCCFSSRGRSDWRQYGGLNKPRSVDFGAFFAVLLLWRGGGHISGLMHSLESAGRNALISSTLIICCSLAN